MRKTIIAGVAAAALAAMTGAAAAQTAAPAPRGEARPHRLAGDADRDGRVTQAEFVDGRVARLTAMDANGDGAVSREEMQAAGQARRAERADRRFARLDADSNGAVSRAEFDAGMAAHGARGPRAERAGRGGGRHGPMRSGARDKAERGPVVIADARAKLTEQFARLDANRDGVATADEQRVARRAWAEQRRERRASRPAQQPASPAPASE